MKIAYIILAHKDIPQVRLLMEAVQGGNVSIYLHLDRLAGRKIFQEARASLAGIQNLTFLERCPTGWGGFGLVKATLEGIRQIIRDDEVEYVILLSGQDYPIKSPQILEQFLQDNWGKSFMEYYQFPHPFWKDRGGYDRIEKWYLSFPGRSGRLEKKIRGYLNQVMNVLRPKRKFPSGFSPYGGSQWWCLYKDCVEYINHFCGENKRFMQLFKTVRVPDEIFFHTILLNSHYNNQIVNRTLTYVDWSGPTYPKILDKLDLPVLKETEYYFARKFDVSVDKEIISEINNEILWISR